MREFFKNCKHNWRIIFVICYPIMLLPIPILTNTMAGYSAYSIALVAGLWLTEVVPSPVAGLVPLFLHPLLGLQNSEDVVKEYMKDAALVCLGGFLLSLAFETCGLHRRLALKVMLYAGSSLTKLLLGIMLTTCFLSLWMFNSSASALMVPIVLAVLEELKNAGFAGLSDPVSATRRASSIGRRFSISELSFDDFPPAPEPKTASSTEHDRQKPTSSKMNNLQTMFLLGISYSANIGGTGVLTGSGPNLIALDILGDLDPAIYGDHANLTFTTWMIFATVPMMLNILIAWVYLQLFYMGFPEKLKFWKKKNEAFTSTLGESLKAIQVQTRLQEKYDQLGPMTSHEIGVATHFVLTAVFWSLHSPKVIPGWSDFFHRKVHISTGTILTSLPLFVIPRNPEFYRGQFSSVKFQPLLEWDYARKGMPWGIFILLGGGLALSSAALSSGLSNLIVQSLYSLNSLPPFGIQMSCLFVIVCLTELMSNTALASIAIPILLQLSVNLNLHPLYITFPAAIACSYAFMLPIATAPNLIVFTASTMTLFQMMKTGFLMSVMSILVLCLTSNFYGDFLFHFSDYKGKQLNSTSL